MATPVGSYVVPSPAFVLSPQQKWLMDQYEAHQTRASQKRKHEEDEIKENRDRAAVEIKENRNRAAVELKENREREAEERKDLRERHAEEFKEESSRCLDMLDFIACGPPITTQDPSTPKKQLPRQTFLAGKVSVASS